MRESSVSYRSDALCQGTAEQAAEKRSLDWGSSFPWGLAAVFLLVLGDYLVYGRVSARFWGHVSPGFTPQESTFACAAGYVQRRPSETSIPRVVCRAALLV